jgi:putative ABC transport system permease protein
VIREVDPAIPVFGVFTMTERVADQTAQSRFTTWVLGAFGAIALLLSTIGIYGVMSYLVAQRTREVGIRIALGATPRQIVQLIVSRGALLVGSGIVAGSAASIALQRVMSTLLFHVSILDAATIAAIAILAATGVLACYVPALRAARVDPLVALRAE